MNLTRYIFLFLIILIFIGLIKCPPGDKSKGKKKARQEGQPSNVANSSNVYVNSSGLQYIYTPPDKVAYHPIQDYEILSSEEQEQINDVEQTDGTYLYEQQQVKNKKVGLPLSFVWTYWTIEKWLFEDGELHDVAVCKFCKQYYMLRENLSSTLKYHLNNAHNGHPEINFDKLNKAKINKPEILRIDQQGETSSRGVKQEKTKEERENDRLRNLTSLIYEYFTIGEKKAYCRCYKNDGEICNKEMSFANVHYITNLKNHLRSHTDANNEFLEKQNKIGEGSSNLEQKYGIYSYEQQQEQYEQLNVEQENEGSQENKEGKKRSPLWEYFGRTDYEDGSVTAKCINCHYIKTINCTRNTKKIISHLESNHPQEHEEYKNKLKQKQSSVIKIDEHFTINKEEESATCNKCGNVYKFKSLKEYGGMLRRHLQSCSGELGEGSSKPSNE